MKINYESTCFDKDFIKRVEKLYNAKYIYETELVEYGPVGSVFYQENPPDGCTNWMAIFYDCQTKLLKITSAATIVEQPVTAIECGDGEWIYSHYTHHFYTKNGVSIDGGRSYTKLVGENLSNIKRAQFIPTKDGLIKQ
jgi:hypothetical protein